jgi:predicted metal-dependent phosphoesterase TrpH
MELMKCDLHVHTIHSGMCTVPLARAFCRESFNDPEAVYQKLKSLGMHLVTVTDHDSIDACERLRRYPDFFLSEEITCRMPSGAEVHIGVYDITERQHIELQRRRDDFERLLSYLTSERVLFSINHMFSGLTGSRHINDYDWFEGVFPCIETRNGSMMSRVNRRAAELANRLMKAPIAGSDAHTMAGVGSAYTVVAGATSKREFLEGLWQGRGIAHGASGSYLKLTRDVLRICLHMVAERPWTGVLSPLFALVPAALAVNYCLEVAHAERWFRRVTQRARRSIEGNVATAGEAAL